METRHINLYEIDPDVIEDIRPVKEDKESYKILEEAMKQDGQFSPITIRWLTDEEKAKAKEGAVYGIIDGHHRFHIAKNNNWETVSANIDTQEPSTLRDAILAFKLNNTAIRMTVEEKGKAIEQLMSMTGEKANTIGETIFGLKTAMAYRCVQAYNKKKQKLEETEQKKKEHASKGYFSITALKKAFGVIPKEKPDIKSWDIDMCLGQLEAIKKIESQLRFYKRDLLEKEGVKEELEKLNTKSNANSK